MISQRCPKCNSDRIRRGYRPTPIWSKLLFRYNLLCDKCNWEFAGFAVPGTVASKPNRKTKKRRKSEESEVVADTDEDSAIEKTISRKPAHRKSSEKEAGIRL